MHNSGEPRSPVNDVPDIEPPPAPDILPGDREGLKPVKEPQQEQPQRA